MLDFLFIVKLFGLVSCYTWRPYIKKYTSGSFTREESIVFENTANYILMLFYIYFISKKFKLLSLFNKINTKNLAIRIGPLLGIMSFKNRLQETKKSAYFLSY